MKFLHRGCTKITPRTANDMSVSRGCCFSFLDHSMFILTLFIYPDEKNAVKTCHVLEFFNRDEVRYTSICVDLFMTVNESFYRQSPYRSAMNLCAKQKTKNNETTRRGRVQVTLKRDQRTGKQKVFRGAPHLLFKHPSKRRCFDSVENPHIGATASPAPPRPALDVDGPPRVSPPLHERQAALRDDPPTRERLVTGRCCVDDGSRASRHHSAAIVPFCSRSLRQFWLFPAHEKGVVAPMPPHFPPTPTAAPATTAVPAIPIPPPPTTAPPPPPPPSPPPPPPPPEVAPAQTSPPSAERNDLPPGDAAAAANVSAVGKRGEKPGEVESALVLLSPTDGRGDTDSNDR